MWKLTWDIIATLAGLYTGYQVFLWSGSHIPAFGYFPIGIVAGLITLWFTAYLVHGVELVILWLEWKIFHENKNSNK